MPTLSDAHVLDGQQRTGGRAEEHVDARLFELVFDGELHGRVGPGDRGDPLDGVIPETPVIGLERIVEPILAGPELDVLGIERTRHVDGLLAQVHRLPPQDRVGIGEAAQPKLPHVEVRRDGVGTQARPPQALLELARP